MNYIVSLDLLLNRPTILKSLEDVTILINDMNKLYSLREDKYRDNPNRIKAQKAIEIVASIYKNVYFSNSKSIEDFLKELDNETVKHNTILITNNVVLWSIAEYHNVNVRKYSMQDTDYNGVVTLELEFDSNGYNQELDIMLNKTDWAEDEIFENEFLIIYSVNPEKKNKELHSIYRFNEGKLQPLSLTQQQIKNPYNSIKPRNPEQIALFNLLRDDKVTILLATGPFGTGKTFCLKNFALEQLEKGKINKIVYVPNNSFNEDTRDIGALPGELFDKELIHLGSWIDLVGYDRLKRYVDESQIELVPISIMRGRSFDNSIIIVNEAQNLTDKHIKLLIGRCGENTRIFFDGDIKQADSDIFRDRSGLRLLTRLKESKKFAPLFGMVKLNTIERSLTAQASAYLDEIE